MINEVPKSAIDIFTKFNFNGGNTLEGDEVIQDNKTRENRGINSIYKVRENMTLESFYSTNKAIFDENYDSDEYKLLYAESKYRDIDTNHNNKISKGELKKKLERQNRGADYRIYPEVGESIEEYSQRALSELKEFDSKFNNSQEKINSDNSLFKFKVMLTSRLGNEYVYKVFGKKFEEIEIYLKYGHYLDYLQKPSN